MDTSLLEILQLTPPSTRYTLLAHQLTRKLELVTLLTQSCHFLALGRSTNAVSLKLQFFCFIFVYGDFLLYFQRLNVRWFPLARGNALLSSSACSHSFGVGQINFFGHFNYHYMSGNFF